MSKHEEQTNAQGDANQSMNAYEQLMHEQYDLMHQTPSDEHTRELMALADLTPIIGYVAEREDRLKGK